MKANQKKIYVLLATSLMAILMAAGCATAKLKNEQFLKEKLPKPGRILVRDFAAPALNNVKPDSLPQIEAGRKVGALIAAQLVRQIRSMGLPAERWSADEITQAHDVIIEGRLISFDKGNKAQRIAIGFGAGASELETSVEACQVTDEGLRPFTLGDVEAKGGKKPGASFSAAGFLVMANPVGLIVSGAVHVFNEASGRGALNGRARQTAREIAVVLKKRFREQGWI